MYTVKLRFEGLFNFIWCKKPDSECRELAFYHRQTFVLLRRKIPSKAKHCLQTSITVNLGDQRVGNGNPPRPRKYSLGISLLPQAGFILATVSLSYNCDKLHLEITTEVFFYYLFLFCPSDPSAFIVLGAI